jgi:Fic family protein
MIAKNFKDLNLPITLLSHMRRIDDFNGTWKAVHMLSPERLSHLKYVATIESIGSSTRIEGVTLTNQEIETFLKNMSTTSFASRDEQEVAGYSDLMNVIFDQYSDLNINENHLKQMHSILLKYSTKDERHRGGYKTLSNSVGAFLDGKLQAIIFETASPFETPLMMTDLMNLYDIMVGEDIHPLISIGIFVVTFLAIHPFQDGNGRLSRALTVLMLLKSNYTYVPYASLERLIEDNKSDYYKALRATQLTLRSENPDFVPWLVFFINCLEKQVDHLKNRIGNIQKIQRLPEGVSKILDLFDQYPVLSIQEISNLLETSRNTIRAHIYQLHNDGFLTKSGSGRNVIYEKRKDP